MRLRVNELVWYGRGKADLRVFESWRGIRCTLWFLLCVFGSMALQRHSVAVVVLWWMLCTLCFLAIAWLFRVLKRRRIRVANATHVRWLNDEVRCEGTVEDSDESSVN